MNVIAENFAWPFIIFAVIMLGGVVLFSCCVRVDREE